MVTWIHTTTKEKLKRSNVINITAIQKCSNLYSGNKNNINIIKSNHNSNDDNNNNSVKDLRKELYIRPLAIGDGPLF